MTTVQIPSATLEDPEVLRAYLIDCSRAGRTPLGGPLTVEGLELAGADFSHWNLSGWRFIGCDLTGARFDGVVGERMEVLSSDCHGSSWTGASLPGARFDIVEGASKSMVLDEADFSDVTAEGLILRHATAKRAIFDRLFAPELIAEHLVAEGSHWKGASLPGGHFCHDSSAAGADFTGLDAPGMCWRGTDLEGATLRVYTPNADYRDAIVTGAHADHGADFSGSTWEDNRTLARLVVDSSTKFDRALLRGAALTDPQRRLVSLKGAQFPLIPQSFPKQRSRRLKGVSGDAFGVHRPGGDQRSIS